MESRALNAGGAVPGLGAPAPPRLGRPAAAILFAVLAAAVAAALGGFAIDDVFITYRYAASLAAGDGLVFNPGERVFGTTSPGTAVLLGLLARATGAPVPRLGAAVTAAALAAIAWLLLASAARRGRPAEGFAAGLLVVGSPLAWVHVGNEMPLALALAMGAAAVLGRAAGAPGGGEGSGTGWWEGASGGGGDRELGGVPPEEDGRRGCAASRPQGPGRHLALGALAGVLAGAAALARPEALAGIAIVALLGGWREARRGGRSRRGSTARHGGSRVEPASSAGDRRRLTRLGAPATTGSPAMASAAGGPAEPVAPGGARSRGLRDATPQVPAGGAAAKAAPGAPRSSKSLSLSSLVTWGKGRDASRFAAGGSSPYAAAGAASSARLAFLVAALAVVAGGGLALAAWFGAPLPETLAVKRLHAAWMPGAWASGLDFWPAVGRALAIYSTRPGLGALLALGVPGLALLARRGGAAERLLALFALVLVVAYPLLGVPMYAWYATVPCLALAAGAAHAAGAVARAVARARPIAGMVLAAALVAAVGGPPAARLAAFLSGEVAPVRYEVYRAAGEWLRRHAAPGERVAALEVGTIGFYAERPIHDLLGLVSRASRPALARGDLPAAFLAGEPDLFVALPANPLSAAIERAPWFPGAFREVVRLRHRRAGFEAVVYRRRPGASAALIAAGASAASPAADRR